MNQLGTVVSQTARFLSRDIESSKNQFELRTENSWKWTGYNVYSSVWREMKKWPEIEMVKKDSLSFLSHPHVFQLAKISW